MARVICPECHVQYNVTLGICPSCGARPIPAWRRMAGWHWPLPLAIGLALQILSQILDRARNAAMPAPPIVSVVSQFIAGVLIFSLLAAVLLFVVRRIGQVVRRRHSRRHRASRTPQ